MENVASNNTQPVIKHCPVFADRNKEAFHDYKIELRVCLSLYSKIVFEVLQGKTQTSCSFTDANATLNAVAEQTWKQANQDLWSVLLLTTSGSARNVSKKFEGKKAKNGTGDGHAAWQALNDKYNSHNKVARRACHDEMVNTKTKPDQNSHDLIFVLNGCRGFLGEMEQTVHDERHDDIILQASCAQYERV